MKACDCSKSLSLSLTLARSVPRHPCGRFLSDAPCACFVCEAIASGAQLAAVVETVRSSPHPVSARHPAPECQ